MFGVGKIFGGGSTAAPAAPAAFGAPSQPAYAAPSP